MGAEISFEARTDRGRVRTNNEDAFLAREGLGLFAVCDGLGGHAAGEVASRMAIETLELKIDEGAGQPERQLREAMEEANRKILRDQQAHPERRGMGTTLSALWLSPEKDDQGWIGHIGDSRVYRFRSNELNQLTEDHSPLYRLYKEGSLNKEQLRHHPQKNLIERSLGLSAGIETDIFSIDLQKGDLFILCTDGLSDCLSDRELSEVCRNTKMEDVVGVLIDRALQCGGYDNITVVVAQIL